jgi:hypothetical protein
VRGRTQDEDRHRNCTSVGRPGYGIINTIYVLYTRIKQNQPGIGPDAYNPSYTGGRDQEDCGLKPAWANSSQDPNSKKILTKKS